MSADTAHRGETGVCLHADLLNYMHAHQFCLPLGVAGTKECLGECISLMLLLMARVRIVAWVCHLVEMRALFSSCSCSVLSDSTTPP